MSFLRGSANYVWCTTSVLGKGATGAVFQGVNKNNGEPVAVKTFNQLSHMRPQEVQMREFEVLKKVKHENIVKLLAIEEEQEGRGKVIVMELCTGGSLFNILDDPENTYGLQEKEFLLVVEHLSAGMKHLRDNNIVHRDLKPGNIMKFINDDGTTVYKLTDFGAARELEEDQQFMSLYGTEEYLHPDMYERAVLRRPVGKTFGATVDLWSIGVTLYHVATGNLPFRPFGGRKNKETMFYITTRKSSGVIAGTQTTENGHIDWNRDLPAHCQLTAGLKKVITPLLAGLLEVDPEKIWSFERFFSEVQERLNSVPIHIFYVNKASCIKVFLKLDDCMKSLQYQICEQTEVLPNNQIILYKDQPLNSVVDETTPGKNYPVTTEDDPIMLFSRNNNTCCSIGLSPEHEIPKFPVFPNLVSVENDASQAKVACSVGHVIKRRVEILSMGSLMTGECVHRWSAMLKRSLATLSARASSLAVLAARLADTARALDAAAQATEQITKSISNSTADETTESQANWTKWSKESQVLNDEMSAGWAAAVSQLHTRHVVGDALRNEWKQATAGVKCPHAHRLPHRAKTLVDKLRDSWQHLVRDRAARSLTYNDEQFHALERVKVTEAGRAARALLDQDCAPHAAATAEALEDWYKVAQTVYLQSQILDKDLTAADLKLRALGARMKEGVNVMKEQLDNVVKQVSNLKKDLSTPLETEKVDSSKEEKPSVAQAKPASEESQAVNIGLKTMFTIQDELATVLAQNSELIKCLYKFQKICKCEDFSS